jgi:hypothetical protein
VRDAAAEAAARAAASRDSDVRGAAAVRRDPRAVVAPVYREVSDAAAAGGAAAADG